MRHPAGVFSARAWAFALLFVAAFSPSAFAQQVYWAGFAYTGDQATVAAATPRSAATAAKLGLPAINKTLWQAIATAKPDGLQLIDQPLAMLDGSTSATVLAASLDRELVSVEPIGDQYKLLVEVALQALFFDFRERQVIASYPITLQRIDIRDQRPTPNEVEAIVGGLLQGNAATDLPQQLAITIAKAKLPNASIRRLQVGTITLADAVRGKLPDPQWDTMLPPTLAHELSKAIATSTGVALLPPAAGQAIGGAMAARFADGKVYQLKIPEPDYVINLQIDALKEGVIAETPAMKTWLFGAFFTASVREPFSGKVFFEQALRKGATKIVPASQGDIDLWSARYETLLAGLSALAGASAGLPESRTWLDEQKPGGKPLQQQTKALQELIKSCR